MNGRMFLIGSGLVSVALSWLGALCAAEAPLAAWVGDDLGLCVETHDLGGSFDQFADSELLKKWYSHPLTRTIWQRRQPELSKAAEQIRARLGLSPVELLREFAADETLFAVWPGSRVELPASGLLLIRSKHHQRVRSTIDYVTSGGKPSPRAADETADLADRRADLYRLSLGAGKPSLWLVHVAGDEQRGSLVLLASHRPAVDRLLDALRGQHVERALSEHPAYQHAAPRTTESATIRVFIQPRSWDALLLAGDEPHEQRARRLRQVLQNTWRACTGISWSLDIHRDVELQAFIGLDEEILPAPARRLLGALQGSPTLPSQLPNNALAKVQLRCDLRALLQELFLPNSQQPSLLPLPKDTNWPVIAALLSSLGPDFQVGLVPTQPGVTDAPVRWPVSWIAKLGSQSAERDDSAAPPAETIVSLLRAWAQFQSYRQTSGPTPPTVDTLTLQDHRFAQFRSRGGLGVISWLVTAKHNALWVGSSAHELIQFLTPATATVDGSAANIEPQQSLSIDLLALRRVLRESADGPEQWRSLKSLSAEDAQRQWNTLIDLLDLADQISAEVRLSGDGLVARAKISASATAD